MDISQAINSDAERLGGAVCFTGTRVPIRNLFDHLVAGHPLDTFLDDYPNVPADAAIAVLDFARSCAESAVLRQDRAPTPVGQRA
jgi:uncharacterized protein (DUF433 family)